MLGTPDPGNVLIQNGLTDWPSSSTGTYSQVSYDPANVGSFNPAITRRWRRTRTTSSRPACPWPPQAIKKVNGRGREVARDVDAPVKVKPPVIAATNAYANDAEMGRALAYWFVADSKGKGNAVIEHVPSYPILGAFTDAFQETVKSLCPDCKLKLVNLTLPQVAGGKITSAMVSALRANPSAEYLVFDYGPFASGIDSALAGAGLSKIKVIGQAADQAAIQALKTGKQAAWTGFQPGYQSYAVFDAMFRDVEGLPIDQKQAGLQPTQILTPDNIGSVNVVDGFWAEPADAPDQFKALWKLSS